MAYINGRWQTIEGGESFKVIQPATEREIGCITLANSPVVNLAVEAAKNAFTSFSQTSIDERVELLENIIRIYKDKFSLMARHISDEMGAPMWLAEGAQTGSGLAHLEQTLIALKESKAQQEIGDSLLFHEPVGVCALITPWNWPVNQIACKVAPALAAGCTMVLKPSEIAPLSAYLFTQILDEAGVPAGVFNMINGDGPNVGSQLSRHPDIDMVSFTGSTRAGVAVAKAAADTVKRVSQELGGKSANILLDDVDLEMAVSEGVKACMHNTGQSCNAPTRMLIPENLYQQAIAVAQETVAKMKVGHADDPEAFVGPVISQQQYNKIQGMIQDAIEEGAELVCGGLGKPQGLEQGFFVKPTIFAEVTNGMCIAQQEVFGPVLVLIAYQNEEQAIEIANDSLYGLSGYVSSTDPQRALKVAKKIRSGMIHINNAWTDPAAPFGGYKQSGNGREWGKFGLEEFQEVKAVMGAKNF
ncbi:aldehyde dehydrogenase family protein [Aliikangiella coralliicola]|uniref:Aldehyde dehydrogenase family protein n=2 Tax=Aliikangiella coralliicola TaxID=2592383 RepID=A0A545UDC1_9GAMM|nr:aldehyde dehydrogenase family protein [Aliikangiella coralliicola]